MFVVLYRWRLKPGMESRFEDGWAEVTRHFLKHHGSLGSRLHRGNDGIWYAYAQWPDAETRRTAFFSDELASASENMSSAVDERFPEVELTVTADYLIAADDSES